MAHPSNVIPPPPSSILIIGAGVFGLSTLHALLTSPRYKHTKLTLVDPYLPSLSNDATDGEGDGGGGGKWQNPHAASIDSSRIIRTDYANPAYTALAAEAQGGWRAGFPSLTHNGSSGGDKRGKLRKAGRRRKPKRRPANFEDCGPFGKTGLVKGMGEKEVTHDEDDGKGIDDKASTDKKLEKEAGNFKDHRFIVQGEGESGPGRGNEGDATNTKATRSSESLATVEDAKPKKPTLDPSEFAHLIRLEDAYNIKKECGGRGSIRKSFQRFEDYRSMRWAKARQMQSANGDGGQIYHESGILVTSTSAGSSYVDNARLNSETVLGITTTQVQGEEAIREAAGLPSPAAAHADNILHKEASVVGDLGYLNPVSGWADAGAAMAGMMASCVALAKDRNRVHQQRSDDAGGSVGEVIFKRAKASQLVFSPSIPPTTSSSRTPSNKTKCTGATLSTTETIHADLTLLAAGAWSGSLLDLAGRVEASGQVVAYAPLTDSEAESLRGMRVLLNLGSGLFCTPPTRQSISNEGGKVGWELKVARHGHGYANPTTVTVPSFTSYTREGRAGEVKEVEITTSLPSAHFSPIPKEGETACRHFLQGLFGPEIGNRPWNSTRICWYADTPTGDFLVDWVPDVEGLVVATGGSGHAFKFPPVIGGKVLRRLEGRLGGEGGDGGGLDEELGRLWRWRERVGGDAGGGKQSWMGDGSRGGKRGMVLWDEWEKGREGKGVGRSKL